MFGFFKKIPPTKTVTPQYIHWGGRLFARIPWGDTWLYFCPICSHELWDGPEGGMCVNKVCPKCNINYGNMPDYPWPGTNEQAHPESWVPHAR